jgi:hypothetical protein
MTASPLPSSPRSEEPNFEYSYSTATEKSTSEELLLQRVRTEPAEIRLGTAPIHHHIAPAIGAPFMKADGLVHRGNDCDRDAELKFV